MGFFTRIHARYTKKYLVFSVPWGFCLELEMSSFQRPFYLASLRVLRADQSSQPVPVMPLDDSAMLLPNTCDKFGLQSAEKRFSRIHARYTKKYLVFSVPWKKTWTWDITTCFVHDFTSNFQLAPYPFLCSIWAGASTSCWVLSSFSSPIWGRGSVGCRVSASFSAIRGQVCLKKRSFRVILFYFRCFSLLNNR